MSQQNLESYHSVDADILEIIIDEPSPCYFDEIDDDLFEAHDENTEELKGYKIMNFKKLGSLKNIKISLPANIEIKPI